MKLTLTEEQFQSMKNHLGLSHEEFLRIKDRIERELEVDAFIERFELIFPLGSWARKLVIKLFF